MDAADFVTMLRFEPEKICFVLGGWTWTKMTIFVFCVLKVYENLKIAPINKAFGTKEDLAPL